MASSSERSQLHAIVGGYYQPPTDLRLPAARRRWPAVCLALGCTIAVMGALPMSNMEAFQPTSTGTMWPTSVSSWRPYAQPSRILRSPPLAAAGDAASSSNARDNYDDDEDDDDDDEPERTDPAELEAAMKAIEDIKASKELERAESAKAAARQYLATKAVQSEASSPESDYVPKVSTWGVFERPKDISKSYGGGRTIKAGRSVPREEAEKRRVELQALISKLKQNDDVTPAMMVAAQNNITQADKWLEKVNYAKAEELYRAVRKAMPFRNRLAGRASLELGTILDAQGRYREAAELYKSLRKHPDGSVRKQAIRLSDSFDALEFFKYSNMTKDKSWGNTIRPLLRRFYTTSSVTVADYHATPQDLVVAKQTEAAAYLIMIALFVLPVGAVVVLSNGAY